MFRELRAHPQEALHKWQLVYFVRVMSFGCTRCCYLTSHTCKCAVCTAPPVDEQVMLETYTGI
jgi:hypothetical protein